MKVVDYIVEYHEMLESLRAHVLDRIAEGWQPLGGMHSVPETEHGYQWYYQTMVKYK